MIKQGRLSMTSCKLATQNFRAQKVKYKRNSNVRLRKKKGVQCLISGVPLSWEYYVVQDPSIQQKQKGVQCLISSVRLSWEYYVVQDSSIQQKAIKFEGTTI